MDLSFTQVTYDNDLSEFSEDELRELVQEFEAAQESNAAEFETAAEKINEIDNSQMEDFDQARSTLIEDITGAETFDDVPLTEDQLQEQDFDELLEWQEFVQEQTEEEDEEQEVEDFGQRAPTQNEDETEDFVEDSLGSMQGVNLN